MKRLLLFLFCLGSFLASNAQFPSTNLKQNFKWGVALGTRDSTAYNAADSLVVVINRQGRMMYRSTDGFWKVLGNTSDSSAILSQVVRTFGAQNVAGVKTFTDSLKTLGVKITATADSSFIFRYPAELRTIYRENSFYPNNFGFNIVNAESNSFFTSTEEGLAHQAYYMGDGDGNTNIWGVSSKINTDTGWIPRLVINQNGFVGIGTNAPLNELTVNGNLSVIGANNSITTRGSLGLVTGSFQSDNTGTFFGTNTNHPLFFRINGAEVARVSTDGNWLIKSSINNGRDALQIMGTSLTRGMAEILAPSLGEYFRAGGGTSSDRSLRFTSYTVAGVAGAGHQINAPNANANLALAVGGVDRLTIFETGVAAFSNRVQATQFRLSALNTAPSSATDTGLTGEIRIDANFIYICTATNTWKRVAISTW